MNHDHLSDEALSALIDQRQAGDDSPGGQAHLASCARCEQRLRELRVVVDMLRGLPEVEPPRSFVLGPRSVAEPPNVVRLRRWYVATRALGASLAAVFVLLVGGSAYLDLSVAPRPASQAAAESTGQAGAQPAVAPASDNAARAAATPSPPAAGAAPRVQAQRPTAPAASDATPSTDQVIATTAVRALPTLTPVRLPPPVAAVVREVPAGDAGGPLRVAASVVGVLAVLSLLLTLVMRHRLRQA